MASSATCPRRTWPPTAAAAVHNANAVLTERVGRGRGQPLGPWSKPGRNCSTTRPWATQWPTDCP
eukprot:1826254-Lingulodinium_polyedra.AAC.1